MANIKQLDSIAAKWARVAGQSQQSYTDGVTNPAGDYTAGAIAANDAWKAGVNQAVAGNRFATGVRKAGNETWQKNSIAKGPARFAQGVAIAQPDYAAGFSPYRETIQSTALPPRGARRSPQNLQRVTVMVTALAAKKEALLKSGA